MKVIEWIMSETEEPKPCENSGQIMLIQAYIVVLGIFISQKYQAF